MTVDELKRKIDALYPMHDMGMGEHKVADILVGIVEAIEQIHADMIDAGIRSDDG